MANGHNDPDNIDPNLYLETVFPIGTVEALLIQRHFINAQVNPDARRPHTYQITMQTEAALDSEAVRQVLEQVVLEIPETPIYHLQWRVELSVAVVTGQQIAAAIRVTPVQMPC